MILREISFRPEAEIFGRFGCKGTRKRCFRRLKTTLKIYKITDLQLILVEIRNTYNFSV